MYNTRLKGDWLQQLKDLSRCPIFSFWDIGYWPLGLALNRAWRFNFWLLANNLSIILLVNPKYFCFNKWNEHGRWDLLLVIKKHCQGSAKIPVHEERILQLIFVLWSSKSNKGQPSHVNPAAFIRHPVAFYWVPTWTRCLGISRSNWIL